VGIPYWIVSILASILVAFSKAGFGGGPGVLATPMMVSMMKSTTAIAVMLPVMLACDVCCVLIYRKKCVWSKVFELLAGFIGGLLIAYLILPNLHGNEIWLKRGTGVMSIVFGLLYFAFFRNNRIEDYFPQSIFLAVPIGILAGVISTLTHGAGPLTAMYFLSQGLKKKNFMGSIVVYALFGNFLKGVIYYKRGLMTSAVWQMSWPLLFAVPLGIALGWYLNRKLSNANFGTWINLLLVGIGVYLIIR